MTLSDLESEYFYKYTNYLKLVNLYFDIKIKITEEDANVLYNNLIEELEEIHKIRDRIYELRAEKVEEN